MHLLTSVRTSFHHLFLVVFSVDFSDNCCQILDFLVFYYPFFSVFQLVVFLGYTCQKNPSNLFLCNLHKKQQSSASLSMHSTAYFTKCLHFLTKCLEQESHKIVNKLCWLQNIKQLRQWALTLHTHINTQSHTLTLTPTPTRACCVVLWNPDVTGA